MKIDISKTAQKGNIDFGYFCKKICQQELSKIDQSGHTGRSPGLVFTGGDTCSEGHGFESQHLVLDGHYFAYICCKHCIVLKEENRRKRGRGWPI